MFDGKFSVFDFAPKVVDKKFRYRDEEPRRYKNIKLEKTPTIS
jgi:hypothetical protein